MFVTVMMKSITAAAQRCFQPYTLALWSLVAVAAVIMGPFGTYSSMPLETRTVYWGLVCGLSVFVGDLVRQYVEAIARDQSEIWRDVLHVVGVTLVLSPIVFLLTAMLGRTIVAGTMRYWTVMLFVFLVTALVSSLRRIYVRHHSLSDLIADETGTMTLDALGMVEEMIEVPPPPKPSVRLYSRLPDGTQGEILHLSARDHFVDVELDGALISLRMRFADAVAEMDGVPGHVTHRSHWVSNAAIDGAERDNGKLVLRLTNGSKVPVSRTAKPKLEEVGVL